MAGPQPEAPATRLGKRISDRRCGPVLFLRGHDGEGLALSALLVQPEAEAAPILRADDQTVAAETLAVIDGCAVHRYRFALAATADASYELAGHRYPVSADVSGDLRIAYTSCNGQENGDRMRDPQQRNALWRRLAAQHAEAPLQLLLHGGDQLYADEMLDVAPELRAWSEGEYTEPPTAERLAAIRAQLEAYLLERYVELYSQSECGWLMARVPSLCMWDDHDICDGWGSLPALQLDAPLGQLVFSVARRFFLLFQLAGSEASIPEPCRDASGSSLGWSVQLPGVAIIAPDLRSERRPDRVMGPAGWGLLRDALASRRGSRTLLLSSVPALGPRLSWVEAAMRLIPGAQKYEDDLRDQWQSRAHREEWAAFLRAMLEGHEADGHQTTVLSGEIHLATRGCLGTPGGPLHQLVASGITHPPAPGAWARTLGALTRAGGSPLPDHPIRLHPLPGQRAVYTTQRNYLMLVRRGEDWSAWWELEADGATPALSL